VAQGVPRTLALERAATSVAARDGVVIWSRLDATRKTYSLVKSVDGGAPTRIRVGPRAKGPFDIDIDLGTNGSGATYAVYTRDDGDIYAEGSPFFTSTAWAGTLLGAATSSAFQDTDACDDETVNICRVQLSGPLEFTLGP